MTTEARPRRVTVFHTTSARIRDVYRQAARRDKLLRGFTRLGDWARLADEAVDPAAPRYFVARVEDEVDPEIERVVAAMPRLLLTEPGTPPDQVARRVQELGLSRKGRFYVGEAPASDSRRLVRLLARVGLAEDRGGIVDAYVAGETLVVAGPGLRRLDVPVVAIEALRGQPAEAVRRFEIDPDGSFLHWPDLDVHLGWDQCLQVVDPKARAKAKTRAAEFDKRYGLAIRRLREETGLTRSDVTGVADRRLARVESGDAPATTATLAALALAHGMKPNAYMTKLAKTMSD